jgi:HEAT repeat protein
LFALTNASTTMQATFHALVRQARQRDHAAIAALGARAEPEALDYLLELLIDADEELRGVVARALGEHGDPRAAHALEALVRELPAQSRARWFAIEALERIGKPGGRS